MMTTLTTTTTTMPTTTTTTTMPTMRESGARSVVEGGNSSTAKGEERHGLVAADGNADLPSKLTLPKSLYCEMVLGLRIFGIQYRCCNRQLLRFYLHGYISYLSLLQSSAVKAISVGRNFCIHTPVCHASWVLNGVWYANAIAPFFCPRVDRYNM